MTALVDTTVVHHMLVELLMDTLHPEVGETLVAVFSPSEDPPSPDDENPDEIWCRLNPVQLNPLPRQLAPDEPDHQQLVAVITVGVSDRAIDNNPTRLTHTMQLVAAVLDGAFTSDASTHELQLDRASCEASTVGEHNHHMIGVVTASGSVKRLSGRTPILTP